MRKNWIFAVPLINFFHCILVIKDGCHLKNVELAIVRSFFLRAGSPQAIISFRLIRTSYKGLARFYQLSSYASICSETLISTKHLHVHEEEKEEDKH